MENMEVTPTNEGIPEGNFDLESKGNFHREVGIQCSLPTDKETAYRETIKDLQRKLNLLSKEKSRAVKSAQSLSENIQGIFNNDQIKFLSRKTMRGTLWSNETVQKALQLRLTCGNSGYQLLRKVGYPLPSERTLQERMEHVKFAPGILKEILPLLKLKVENMNEAEKESVLLIDEMSITPGLEYDSSVGQIIGRATMSSASGDSEQIATHALVFMIGGMSTRWKQTIAYHMTSNSFSPKEMKAFTFDLIRSVEETSIQVNAIVLAMGGQNQAFVRECGILAGRYSTPINSCPHPCSSERQLFFIFDAPHVLKNIRNLLINNQEITLPTEIVTKHNFFKTIIGEVQQFFHHLSLSPRY